VAIGLLWFPMVARLGKQGLDFVLALTVGLLVFLMADASAEGIETAQALPGSYQGMALLVFAAGGAYVGLEAVGTRLKRSRAALGSTHTGLVLALLIAIGIGLHNFGEGLAIGAAFALGETVLGSLLIMGFALHNTTEGLAIVAPLARDAGAGRKRVPIAALIRLGVIGGAPTIAGAWLGAFVYSQVWALVFLGLGVGAIAQVTGQILRQMAAGKPLGGYLASGPVLAGLLTGFVVMYSTGMLIG
jgi:ZIP family zinc transporter